MVNGGPQLELSTSKALRVWTSQTAPRQIQLRFVDRVLPNVGLCIEFYNFVSIKAEPLPLDRFRIYGVEPSGMI